ncbi:MAG: TRAP transporter small permease subunit [bacterium]
MPHWMYWPGLLLLPLVAMYLVRNKRPGRKDGAVNLMTAYLFLFCAGFIGIHRFYLKNFWGLAFIPFFLAIVVYLNPLTRDAREIISNAKNEVSITKFDLENEQKDLSDRKERASPAKVEAAEQAVTAAKAGVIAAYESQAHWNFLAKVIASIIALMLLIDAFLLPGLVRRVAEKEADLTTGGELITDTAPAGRSTGRGHPSDKIETPVTRFIDKISGFSGEFVSYWSLIAVFVYYYEVVARYVFNSPTNWAHEGMFLMFGMQYLLSGALALREDSHVRVDILYLLLSDRTKAITNLLSSIFFFLFAGALFWTGIIFAMDSIAVWEVSFTEWAIQYWPVKLTIVLGALMLLLQGIAVMIKDVLYLTGKEA